jgi:hypothetical protein
MGRFRGPARRGDSIYGRAEYFFSPAISKNMIQNQVLKWYPLYFTAVNTHDLANLVTDADGSMPIDMMLSGIPESMVGLKIEDYW